MIGLLMVTDAPPPPDPTFSGNWLVNAAVILIPVIAAALVVIFGKNHWKAQGTKEAQRTTTTIANQPIGVRIEEDDDYVTHGKLKERLDLIVGDIEEIKLAMNSERGVARTANGNLHARIDALSERLGDRLSSLEGTTRAVNDTVGRLLDLALGKKPGTRS